MVARTSVIHWTIVSRATFCSYHVELVVKCSVLSFIALSFFIYSQVMEFIYVHEHCLLQRPQLSCVGCSVLVGLEE